MTSSIKKLLALNIIMAAILLAGQRAVANITLPAIIGDHMVVQANKDVKIWGWADPGQSITVALAGQNKTTTTAPDGSWRVTLNPVQSNKPLSMTIKGKNIIHISDILVGQVWLCSGQSNMEHPLIRAENGEQIAADATNKQLRLFHMVHNVVTTPSAHELISHPASSYGMWGVSMKGGTGKWVVCNPKDAAKFSAVGYLFGRELYQKLGQPVGLIECAWGGTAAELWTSAAALATLSPKLQSFIQKKHTNHGNARKKFLKAHARWNAKHNKPPHGIIFRPYAASVLFNGMIYPIIPFAIRGAIWYQGAGNGSTAYSYREVLPAMIQDWRRRWGQGDFPVGIVQLPNFRKQQTKPVEWAWWPVIRESQLLISQKMRNVGMTVNIDIGEAKRVHPQNKIPFAHRLALWALAKAYRKNVIYSGPIFSHMIINGNKVRLFFKHVDGGLVAKGHDGKLVGFAIAGADQKFHWAKAKIAGNKVILYSKAVPHPVAVRYAWASNPVCNLYNKAGLPTSPFRTDKWRVMTQPR